MIADDVRFLQPQVFLADLDEPVSVLLGKCLSIGKLSCECIGGGLVLAPFLLSRLRANLTGTKQHNNLLRLSAVDSYLASYL